jgi:hypothetical protein
VGEGAGQASGPTSDRARHVTALQSHSESIVRHDEDIVCHERNIVQCERSEGRGADEIGSRLAKYHEQEASKQLEMREFHERLKRYHHRAMAKIAVVLEALDRDT